MKKSELISLLRNEGFSEKIIAAFRNVDREKFIAEENKLYAYENSPLPIGEGATISQPYTIAYMFDLLELEKNQKILEIGSGSGYVLALLNEITSGEIYGMEICSNLAKKSEKILREFKNIRIIKQDGSDGLKSESPFDRILVSASFDKMPSEILEQLKVGGIIVLPVKNSIFKIRKGTRENSIEEHPGFVFVPIKKKI